MVVGKEQNNMTDSSEQLFALLPVANVVFEYRMMLVYI